MSLPTYETQIAWKEIQKSLPPSLHLTESSHPVEEFWTHNGHSIHLDRWRLPSAKVRVILHHGVGTNGRQLSMILGIPLHNAGFEVVALDMPNYGMTKVSSGKNVTYNEWVTIASDFIDYELQNDKRKIVLYGLSAGGMLAYHAAALNKKVSGIIGMTFLDQRIQQVADETTRTYLISRLGIPLTNLFASLPLLSSFSIPMSLASKMWALCNNPITMKHFYADPTSAGNWVTMRFLSTYMKYKPVMEPEDFDVCDILLTQPGEDRWSPEILSRLFLDRVKKVKVDVVVLEGAGHYPVEEEGLAKLAEAIIVFLRGVEGA